MENGKSPSDVIREKLEGIEQTVLAKVAEVEKKFGDSEGNVRKEVEAKLADMRATIEKQQEQLNAANRNSVPGLEIESEKKKFSFARYAALTHPGIRRDVEGLKEYGHEMEIMRAQTAGDSTAGGYAVPTELADMIIEPAIAAMPIYGLGITTLTDVQGTFDIPTMTSRGTAGHATENASATEVAMTFGKKTMSPKRAAGYVVVSKRLIRQASAGIEGFIRSQLQKTLQLEIHEKLIKGTGSSGQPTGVTVESGFTTTSPLSAAGTFLIKHAQTMMTDLEEANVDINGGNMGFLTRPIVLQGMKNERVVNYSGQTANLGYAVPAIAGMNDQQLADLVGAKFAKTTQVPTSGTGSDTTTSVVYGDWSKFLLALWTGLEIRASDTASDGTNHTFLQNSVMIIAEQEYDCVITRPDAFCKTTYAYANRGNWVY